MMIGDNEQVSNVRDPCRCGGCDWRFALVGGIRRDIEEVESRQRGICPLCNGEMVARKGKVRVAHWSHLSGTKCDDWYQPKSAWHIAWQNQFPKEWQEVPFVGKKGEEAHIADIHTPSGWTIECQRSKMSNDEKLQRERFYGNIIWIVAGEKAATLGVGADSIRKWTDGMICCYGEYRLLNRENKIIGPTWTERTSFVFVDMSPGMINAIAHKELVCFVSGNPIGAYDVCCVIKASDLINAFLGNDPSPFLNRLLAFRDEQLRYFTDQQARQAFDREHRWSPSKPVVYYPLGQYPVYKTDESLPVPITECVSFDEQWRWKYAALHARWPKR